MVSNSGAGELTATGQQLQAGGGFFSCMCFGFDVVFVVLFLTLGFFSSICTLRRSISEVCSLTEGTEVQRVWKKQRTRKEKEAHRVHYATKNELRSILEIAFLETNLAFV